MGGKNGRNGGTAEKGWQAAVDGGSETAYSGRICIRRTGCGNLPEVQYRQTSPVPVEEAFVLQREGEMLQREGEIVPRNMYLTALKRIEELERALGRKTLENDI